MKISNAHEDSGSDRFRPRDNSPAYQIDCVVLDHCVVEPDPTAPCRRVVFYLRIEPRSGAIIDLRLHSSLT